MSSRRIMSANEMRRALVRMGHEIVERQGGAAGLALVGIQHRGPVLAERIAAAIAAREGVDVPVTALDVTPYRDDLGGALDADAVGVIAAPELQPYDPSKTTVVLVDDVLYTGRTARAALDALTDHGRPAAIRLAVLIDRGHRELPIRADFVGKNIPSASDERVVARISEGLGDDDEVVLVEAGER